MEGLRQQLTAQTLLTPSNVWAVNSLRKTFHLIWWQDSEYASAFKGDFVILVLLIWQYYCSISWHLAIFTVVLPYGNICWHVIPLVAVWWHSFILFPNINMFTVDNRNKRKRCETCSKLTIKRPERRHWSCFGVFIINFEHISHLFLLFLLSTLSR